MSAQNRLRRAGASGVLGACLLAGASSAVHAQAAPAPRALGIEVRNMDPSVLPQDDFFRYVNGAWLKGTEIPADRSSYSAFTELAEQSEQALKALIEEAAADRSAAPGSDAQKVGDYYRSYMDTARIEALGITPLRAELDRIAALRDRDGLPELFAHLSTIGVQTPVGGYVGQDARDAQRYVAYASQSGTGLPDRDYYLEDDARFVETRAAYEAYVARLLGMAGEEDPAAAAKEVLALETRLARAQWDRVRTRDREATYNPMDAAALEALMPSFSWSRYARAAGLERTPVVVVRMPDFFQALDGMIAEVPTETWKRYLTFKLVHAYADELSSPFVDAKFDFTGRVLSGQQENRPRWKRAVSASEDALGEVLGRMYVERHFRPEARQRMAVLVANLREAFREGIDGLEWMSPETRAQAQDKLAKFTTKIGFPERWRDYSALDVRADDLVGNAMRTARFEHARMVGRLGQPVDRAEWFMTPQTVNAYYSSTMNEIVFPAAILQPPFFDVNADDAVNYGAIGAVIGHEISHGFDDQGRRSDGDGNLRDWWTGEDSRAFEERAARLAAQYDAQEPLEGARINGRLTLGENIGDLSGLAVAYRAYRSSLDGAEAPVIEGFTGDQRFFMGWAQVWRSKFRDPALRQYLLTNSHSPGEYRTNVVLRNLPEFAAAFGVRPGDGMYLPPEEQVKIW